jgi:hypothetical protein
MGLSVVARGADMENGAMYAMDEYERSGMLDVSASWGRVLVRIPDIASEKQYLELVSELYGLYQVSLPGSHWVVDVSGMKSITLSLATVLVYLGERLKEQGGLMTCTGLGENTFSGDSMHVSNLFRRL